jgi:RNA polymerase subunit RPABC4/transcription elongation factor Spt4
MPSNKQGVWKMSGQVSLIDGHIDNAETCVCCGRVIPEDSQYCVICGQKPKQKQRRVDRIRNMSIEEMAEFVTCINNGWVTETGKEICKEKHLKYLESEVTE